MATAIDTAKSMHNDPRMEKENRRPDKRSHIHQVSSNSGSSGSAPKRYQSVFAEGTPISSFGVRTEETHARSQSPSTHPQPQNHQRPLKPVKEFLTTQLIVDQHADSRQRPTSQASNFNRTQTDATVQNVNAALAKTLNVLRPNTSTSNSGATNVRTNPLYVDASPNRPMTARSTLYQQSVVNGFTRGPLPPELITKRPSNAGSSVPSQNRIISHSGPMIVQQSTITSPRSTTQSIDFERTSTSTAIRVVAKSLEIDGHRYDHGDRDDNGHNDNSDRFKSSKIDNNQQTPTKLVSKKGTPAPPAPNGGGGDRPHRSLPEVSVNPHIESPVQKNGTKGSTNQENVGNGIETNAHRHHIRVEPTDTFKRVSSPVKHHQIADIKPSVTVQHQRPLASSMGGSQVADNLVPTGTNDPLNDAYIERYNPATHLKLIDPATKVKHKKSSESTVTSPSLTTEESDDFWKKPRQRYSVPSAAALAHARQRSHDHRPPGRLKNYEDESDSETTATETQSKHENMAARVGLPPSDLGSDAWSDLTSEFSDTKLRKHPNIRTSTPNMTRQSSSISSKEVGQIRKQLTDLQIMYNDLLKLLDIDLESVRGSLKSSTSSQIDHHHQRKHRFRKVVPLASGRHSNGDMKEINQRFSRLESSIVTLAESIAKLSTQVQMQRNVKDDIHHLRQEVADLRQQVHRSHSAQRPTTPAPSFAVASSSASQPASRFASPHSQKLPPVNNTNPSNASTSFMPSTSIIQRTNSIIDPRQARKIEQFFGREAMLRYFLSLLNYEEYTQVLEDEKIGIYELPYVSERKLQSLGIPYGPCARIIYEAQQYFISLLTLRSSGIDV